MTEQPEPTTSSNPSARPRFAVYPAPGTLGRPRVHRKAEFFVLDNRTNRVVFEWRGEDAQLRCDVIARDLNAMADIEDHSGHRPDEPPRAPNSNDPNPNPMLALNRAGQLWDNNEDEKLRVLWANLIVQMGGRSTAAVHTRLNMLAQRYYRHDWPNQKLT